MSGWKRHHGANIFPRVPVWNMCACGRTLPSIILLAGLQRTTLETKVALEVAPFVSFQAHMKKVGVLQDPRQTNESRSVVFQITLGLPLRRK